MKRPKIYVRKDRNIIYVDYEIDNKRYQKSTYLKGTTKNLLNVEKVIDQIMKKDSPDFNDISKRFTVLKNVKKLSKKINKKQIDDIEIEEIDKVVKLTQYYSGVKQIMINERNNKKLNNRMYEFVFNDFETIVTDKLISNITDIDTEKYKDKLKDRGLSYHSIQTYIRHLHIFFNWCINNDYYDKKNPVTKLKERDKKHITIIKDEHMKLILEALAETPIYNFIRFLKYTAFRRTEAFKLKWSQIDFDNDVINVITYKDNQRQDVFPLNVSNGELRKMLKDMLKKKTGDLVFDLKMYDDTPLKIFQRKVFNLNLPKYTLHDMRRTTISNWAAKLLPNELIKLSRHKDIKTAMKYYINLEVSEIGAKV